MNKEFFAAIEAIENESGIPREYLLEKIEAALTAAYKKEFGTEKNVRIVLDSKKKDVRVFQQKEVVAEVTEPETQISLEDARAINHRTSIGKILETEVHPKNFSRLSALAGKSIIVQGIHEAQRKIAQDAYEKKKEEIISAVVSKVDTENGNIIIETGNGFAALRPAEQIPGEVLTVGQRIKVYVCEVNREAKGPIVTISRAHAGLVSRMFELEVPEIADGTVQIKGIAREAGSRTKIAVISTNPNVDAVGSCVGNKGIRINTILAELGAEKVDIVRYSEDPAEYIAAALAPATIEKVEMLDERTAHVVVAPEQLSLAIGKEGQNARLAARLTGCKIDIKSE